MLENKRAETLRLLRESGENVSGQDLCEHFGISRTAVWKIMNQLKEEGYEIEAVQNKGYRLLNEPDLMTKDELESRTHTKYVGQTVYYSHEVDSTNTWAKRLAEEGAPNGTLTTAETQTAGKGRRGRKAGRHLHRKAERRNPMRIESISLSRQQGPDDAAGFSSTGSPGSEPKGESVFFDFQR